MPFSSAVLSSYLYHTLAFRPDGGNGCPVAEHESDREEREMFSSSPDSFSLLGPVSKATAMPRTDSSLYTHFEGDFRGGLAEAMIEALPMTTASKESEDVTVKHESETCELQQTLAVLQVAGSTGLSKVESSSSSDEAVLVATRRLSATSPPE
ncbi:unnamed protein product, partial [Protopolystoma xenopodis]